MAIAEHQSTIAHIVTAPNVRPVGHVAATGAIFLSWVHIFGEIASVIATIMAVLWYGVTLYESATGQKIIAWAKAKFAKKPKVTPPQA